MSQLHSIQDGTGAVERIPGRGILEAWGTGAPSNGVVGYAPGAIYHRVDGGAGTALYVNEGTYSSSTWVLSLTPSSTPTFASATITDATITNAAISNAAITTSALTNAAITNGAISNGSLSGTLTAGNGAVIAANASNGGLTIASNNSQKVGLWGATPVVQPSSTGELLGFNGNGATNANAVNFNSNGNSGSTLYNFGDVVKALKQAGILKA